MCINTFFWGSAGPFLQNEKTFSNVWPNDGSKTKESSSDGHLPCGGEVLPGLVQWARGKPDALLIAISDARRLFRRWTKTARYAFRACDDGALCYPREYDHTSRTKMRRCATRTALCKACEWDQRRAIF